MARPRRFPSVLTAAMALVLMASMPSAQARPSSPQQAPLQERMSYAEFTRLGLDKLSPAQLKALNAWLRTHGESGPPMGAIESPQAAASAKPKTRTVARTNKIHSHIVGTFRGWGSDTVFTLANGQRWQVADDSQLMIHSIKNPKVTLYRNFFGSWLLSVKGVDQNVHVTRMH